AAEPDLMGLTQSIDLAYETRIGREGVTEAALADALVRAGEALAWIKARHADGKLPLLRLPEQTSDLKAINDAAHRIATGATDIVFLGTGGSSRRGTEPGLTRGPAAPGLGIPPRGPRQHFILHPPCA